MRMESELRRETSTGPSGRRLWLLIAGLVVVACVVMFYRLGDYRSLASHEAYTIVPAREMLETGEWIVPRSGGLPRLRKPPLGYWVVAASATVCGQLNEWTARLPAAVSAILLAVLVGFWANRWYGRAAGLGVALVQLTSAWVVLYARKAEIDMLLCLLTTAALFLVADWPADEPRRRTFFRWSAIYALLSLSWMGKFQFGPVMVLAPSVLYLIVQRRFDGLRSLANPVGLLIAGAAVLAWPYLVVQQLPEAWEIWKRETLGRAVGSLGHMPLWYYLPYFVSLPLPWTGFVFAAVPASWRKAWKEGDARERFLWIWILVQVAIVTALADKHKHYLLAMLPAFSLLAGQTFVRWSRRVRRPQPLLGYASAAAWSLLGLAPVAAAWLIVRGRADAEYLLGPVMAVAAIAWAGTVIVVWLLAAGRSAAGGCTAIAVFLAVYVCVMSEVVPAQDHRRQAVRFSAEIRSELEARLAGARGASKAPGSGGELIAYRLKERDPVVFYVGSPVSRAMTAEAVREKLNRRGRRFVVTYQPYLDDLTAFRGRRIVKRMRIDPGIVPPKHPPLVLVELTAPAIARAE